METGAPRWWQTRWFVALAALAAAIPLLWPSVPPLIDLPGHMGRYRVQIDGDRFPHLLQWFDFRWQLIGNLGVDLLIVPLAPLVGLEFAVKLVVIAIPVSTAAGLLWIAREVHGRVPGTAYFALPLAYGFPFQFGFVNFALSMGIALLLFALWLRLGRLHRVGLRAAVFLPASCLLWLCHTFGWGVLGVLAFAGEMVRAQDARRAALPTVTGYASPSYDLVGWAMSWVRAGLRCWPLMPPFALMILWRSGEHVTGRTIDWFNWPAKYNYLAMVLRDRWMAWDLACATLLFVLLFRGVRDDRVTYSRMLGLSALFLGAIYILLPRVVFGSAYADMRLIPFAVAIAVIGLRYRPELSPVKGAIIAAAGVAFYGARLAVTTWSFLLYDRSYSQALAMIDRVPEGARVVSFVGRRCADDWAYSRLEHVPALLMERRLAYTNDQWSMAGAQLLTARYRPAGRFAHDPSQVVTFAKCRGEWWRPVGVALNNFPRNAFDYVWLVRAPRVDPAHLRGLTPIARDAQSVLYRVTDRTQPTPILNRRGGTA